MFDPVEADLYAFYRDQEERAQRDEIIGEAVEAFLVECCDVKGFREFVDAGHITLAEMKSGLLRSAHVEDDEVYFWARSPEEFVETMMSDYEEER